METIKAQAWVGEGRTPTYVWGNLAYEAREVLQGGEFKPYLELTITANSALTAQMLNMLFRRNNKYETRYSEWEKRSNFDIYEYEWWTELGARVLRIDIYDGPLFNTTAEEKFNQLMDFIQKSSERNIQIP